MQAKLLTTARLCVVDLQTLNDSSMCKEYDFFSIEVAVFSFVDVRFLLLPSGLVNIHGGSCLADSRTRKIEVALQEQGNVQEQTGRL